MANVAVEIHDNLLKVQEKERGYTYDEAQARQATVHTRNDAAATVFMLTRIEAELTKTNRSLRTIKWLLIAGACLFVLGVVRLVLVR